MQRFINPKDEKGFTLIELLVVVIIIGVLAAIAIPVYVGVQNSAKDSSVQSELTNAKIAVVAYYSDKGTYPPAITTGNLQKYGFTGTAVTDASSATAAITAFCLKAKSGSGNWWYIIESGTPTSTKPATCIAGP